MIPAPFSYVRPASVEEVLAALADPEAKVLAGGHSLVPMMKLRLARPSALVDIGRLDLRGVARRAGELAIGALTRYDDLVNHPGSDLPDALREAASAVGDVQVRNAGTIGGALAHGDPASDIAAAVAALGAVLRVRSAAGERDCQAADFFVGPYSTALEQQELLVEVAVPLPAAHVGSAYRSIDAPASGYPLAGAAVRIGLDGDRVDSCAVALTGALPTPARLFDLERALEQAPADASDVTIANGLAGLKLSGGADEHRRQLAVVAIQRAYRAAHARARAGGAA